MPRPVQREHYPLQDANADFMRFTISKVLLAFVPLAFLLMAVVPWPQDNPVQWEHFSIDGLANHLAEGRNVAVFARTRYGMLNPWVEHMFDQRRVRRAFYDGHFVAMDIELAYASPPPRGQEKEMRWLMDQKVGQKDAFVVIVRSDGSTVAYNPITLTAETFLDALSIRGYSDWSFRAVFFFLFAVSTSLLTLRQRPRHRPCANAGT